MQDTGTVVMKDREQTAALQKDNESGKGDAFSSLTFATRTAEDMAARPAPELKVSSGTGMPTAERSDSPAAILQMPAMMTASATQAVAPLFASADKQLVSHSMLAPAVSDSSHAQNNAM